MDPQAPGNLPTNQDVTYQVMPQDGGSSAQYVTPAQPAAPPPPHTPAPPSAHTPLSYEPETSFFRTWKFYTLIAVAAALILGVAGWFLFGSEKPNEDDQQTVTRLPKVWLKQYFDKEVCDDNGICGDEADSDSDGLKNYEEFKAGTSPVNNDSDSDGLADGDEALIFKTEATLKFTDRRDVVAQNNWTDGYQIKNGYDPLTPGLKFTELRKQQIEADKARLGYHEPTITTLGNESSSDNKSYVDSKFSFVFKYPSDLIQSADVKENSETVSVYAADRQAYNFVINVNGPELNSAGTKIIEEGQVMIGGVSAKKQLMEVIEGHEKGMKTVIYTFNKGTDKFRIQATISPITEGIINSFKFTK